MTDTRRPDPCHYDRGIGTRVTKRHRQGCATRDCDGCAPCTAPHCHTCGRGHLDNTHPHTCPDCVRSIRDDLTAITEANTGLAIQAYAATAGGALVAAAPIPGGDAQVLIGPTVRLPFLRTYRGYTTEHFRKDHPVSSKTGRPSDPIPPLAILAQWEDLYRAWLGLSPTGRASLSHTCRVLRDDVIPVVAQDDPADGGPDLTEMATQVRRIRDQLERALHDEREPDRGVTCFECDSTLVRRYRRPKRCGCPRRPLLRHADHGPCTCMTGVRLDRPAPDKPLVAVRLMDRDPDDGHIHARPDLSCIACHRQAQWAAEHAGHNQGGLSDPAVGMSWECPGCRKTYTPGEYQNAVRVELASKAGGWITIPVAVEAAAAVAVRPVTDKTIRGWVTRDWVKSRFEYGPSGLPGPRLVRWSDVRREAERLGAGRNQCTHVTPAREWVKILETYPELEVFEDERDACRDMCDACADAVASTLHAVRRSVVA